MTATKPIYKPAPDVGPVSMRSRRVLGTCLLAMAALLASPGAFGQPEGRGPPAALGAFEVDAAERSARGEHVSFRYDDAGIHDFAAGNATLFSIRVTGGGDDDDRRPRDASVKASGSEMRVRTLNYSFTAHDNPSGVARMQSEGDILVSFAEGAVLAQAGEERIQFEVEGLTGTLRGEDLEVRGRAVRAEGNVLIFLDKARGSFDKHRDDIGDAIAKGHVGAEATFHRGAGGIQEEVVSYANVTMTTLKAEEGNLTVLIDGHGTEGRVLVLNVDSRIIAASAADELNVLMDNFSIQRASGLVDILDPEDDGYQPEYYPVLDPQLDAFQLIVTVPHYSVHTLSVTSFIVLPPPSVVIGALAGVALLVPSAMLLFRRR